VQRGALAAGSQIQLGNVTLKFSPITGDGGTEQIAELPWIEQQHLLLSLVQALNSTLVLSQVLEQVLEAVMQITRAERGFLLLVEGSADAARHPVVAGLRVHVGRRRGASVKPEEMTGLSTSVVRRAMETGQTVATGTRWPTVDRPGPGVVLLDTPIVCIPCGRRARGEVGPPPLRGAIYVDNQRPPPFSGDASTVEAGHDGRHQNALLFGRAEAHRGAAHGADAAPAVEKLATIGQMARARAEHAPHLHQGNLELLQNQPAGAARRDALVDAWARSGSRARPAPSRSAVRTASSATITGSLVERSLELCHYQILKGGVHLRKELSASLPRVRGVSNQLETALINLVVNAVHAMEGGGTLQVATASRDGHVEIAVADTGQGIPVEIQPTIFEPFFTTSPRARDGARGCRRSS
jgi:hypothetical protein